MELSSTTKITAVRYPPPFKKYNVEWKELPHLAPPRTHLDAILTAGLAARAALACIHGAIPDWRTALGGRGTDGASGYLFHPVVVRVLAILFSILEFFLEITQERLVIFFVARKDILQILIGRTDGIVAIFVILDAPRLEDARPVLQKCVQTVLVVIHGILVDFILTIAHGIARTNAVLEIEALCEQSDGKENNNGDNRSDE